MVGVLPLLLVQCMGSNGSKPTDLAAMTSPTGTRPRDITSLLGDEGIGNRIPAGKWILGGLNLNLRNVSSTTI